MKLKKIFTFALCMCLILSMCTSLFACNKAEAPTEPATEPTAAPTDAPTNKPVEKETDYHDFIMQNADASKYDALRFTYPFWQGNVCFSETVLVAEYTNEGLKPFTLLYPATKIISVRDITLETLYEEGKDYKLTSDGKLEIVAGGKIDAKKLAYNKYHIQSYIDDGLRTQLPSAENDGTAYIRAEIGQDSLGMSQWCVAVTYEHEEGNCVITEPDSQSKQFTKLIEKIESIKGTSKNLKVVSMGDSITDGWSSSAFVGQLPGCPSYNRLFVEYLEKAYDIEVDHDNQAVSGMDIVWAAQEAQLSKMVAAEPDLLILAMGMNNGGTAPVTFVDNVDKIIKRVKQDCPDACIIVVGTCMPNPNVLWSPNGSPMWGNQDKFIDPLWDALLDDKGWDTMDVGFADVGTAHIEMMERKTYEDTAGSNSNHPNDYVHRLYAQVMIQTIFGEFVPWKVSA